MPASHRVRSDRGVVLRLSLLVMSLANRVVITAWSAERWLAYGVVLPFSFAFGVGHGFWPYGKRESQPDRLRAVDYFTESDRGSDDNRIS